MPNFDKIDGFYHSQISNFVLLTLAASKLIAKNCFTSCKAKNHRKLPDKNNKDSRVEREALISEGMKLR